MLKIWLSFLRFRLNDSGLCSHLFQLILKRHNIFRSFHILKSEDLLKGKNQPYVDGNGVAWEWYNTNVNSFRPLSERNIRQLLSKFEPSQLTEYYSTEDGDGAITFACAIRDRKSDVVSGILVAEIALKFIQPVIDGADVNRTGDVLVADKAGKVIFSTRGFSGLEDFNNFFPIADAYANVKGGIEYKGNPRKLAAYTRIRGVTSRSLMSTINMFPFPTTVSRREIPDWLIVVVQDSSEGYLVADRMKWNIALLLMIGAIGVLIIGKLWVDSIR